MALPEITINTFEEVIPTENKKITMRPFLVKEQKILLIAQESENEKDILHAIKQILTNCILSDNIDIENMALCDMEYLFAKLRAKSYGETLHLHYKCANDDCKGIYKHKIDINDLEVQNLKGFSKVLKIDNNIGITFKVPSYKTSREILENKRDNEFENTVLLFYKCTSNVFDGETLYEDFSFEEYMEFIEKLTDSHYNKILQYFENLPKIHYEIKFKCPECGFEDLIVINSLTDFFV